MKKQNKLNYSTSKQFFIDEDIVDKSYFKVFGSEEPELIYVPNSIMHRFYRLGQAYGIRQLRYLESECRFMIGDNELKEFVKDLGKLKELLNDEVVHYYIDLLLKSLGSPTKKLKHISVSTGDFFSRN
jgi:hypothetical protein